MALFTIPNVKIAGISACAPKKKESNLDYDVLTPNELRLLVKTTGVEYRRIADNDVCTSDMCFVSAEKLINDLNWDKKDIQAIIFVSQTPDYFIPATGILLQDRLKLPKSSMAFDVNLGCSGYVYGLSVISNIISSKQSRKALLLVGDKSTFSISKRDKSTYPLFGDAGTATALEFDKNASEMVFNLQSDGSGYKAIMVPEGGLRSPINVKSLEYVEIEKGISRSGISLHLNGPDVFNFSLREVPPNIKELYLYNSTSNEDYDYFVFHQANKLIIESIRKKLKIESEKVPYSINNFGNTSSGSIPLTIVTELKEKLKNKSVSLLLIAFGVGLSWGTVSVRIDNMVCPDLIEI